MLPCTSTEMDGVLMTDVESLVCLTATKGKRVPKAIFFSKDLSLLPETRQVMEHFKLVFGSW